jgi:hypothetical protein
VLLTIRPGRWAVERFFLLFVPDKKKMNEGHSLLSSVQHLLKLNFQPTAVTKHTSWLAMVAATI